MSFRHSTPPALFRGRCYVQAVLRILALLAGAFRFEEAESEFEAKDLDVISDLSCNSLLLLPISQRAHTIGNRSLRPTRTISAEKVIPEAYESTAYRGVTAQNDPIISISSRFLHFKSPSVRHNEKNTRPTSSYTTIAKFISVLSTYTVPISSVFPFHPNISARPGPIASYTSSFFIATNYIHIGDVIDTKWSVDICTRCSRVERIFGGSSGEEEERASGLV